jgi:DNA replicative helicase MCM subunit Mcm2 (Cdc46/Mcm family)
MLESLVRLSQAHARLMFRDEVQLLDAVVAISITESSLHTSSVLEMDSVLHEDFHGDPDEQLREQTQVVLGKLGLR